MIKHSRSGLSLTICTVGILLAPCFVYANEFSIPPCEKATKIYFANGVKNSPAQARAMKEKIKSEYYHLLSQESPGETFEFEVAYNHSDNLLLDVIEAFRQKLYEYNKVDQFREHFTDIELAKLMVNAAYYTLPREIIEDPDVGPLIAGVMNDAAFVADMAETMIKQRVTNLAADITDQRIQFENDLNSGYRLLVIAHSQGNLFMNSSLADLAATNPNNIAVIGVATPASKVLNDYPYITLDNDRVINAVRLLAFPRALPSNFTNSQLNNSWLHYGFRHSFLDAYFDEGLDSRNIIDSYVRGYLRRLEYPQSNIVRKCPPVMWIWEVESEDLSYPAKKYIIRGDVGHFATREIIDYIEIRETDEAHIKDVENQSLISIRNADNRYSAVLLQQVGYAGGDDFHQELLFDSTLSPLIRLDCLDVDAYKVSLKGSGSLEVGGPGQAVVYHWLGYNTEEHDNFDGPFIEGFNTYTMDDDEAIATTWEWGNEIDINDSPSYYQIIEIGDIGQYAMLNSSLLSLDIATKRINLKSLSTLQIQSNGYCQ